MLQTINERTKGIIAWAIVILVAITFAIFGAENFFQTSSRSNTVAQINGVEISQSQLLTETERFRRQQLAQLGEEFQITQAIDNAWKNQALEQLILSELLKQTSHALGLHVSLEQAHAAIVTVPYFQEDGQFSQQLFQQVLSSSLYTPDSYVQQLREGMLLNQLRSGLGGTAFTLDSDLQNAIQLLGQTRDIAYLTIDTSRFNEIAQPTDEAIKQYYDAHLDQFSTPERMSIEYIELSQQALLDKINISDKEISDYYDLNKSLYTTPAQWRIAHILIQSGKEAEEKLQRLTKEMTEGKAFSELVKQYSDDVVSAQDEGVLPWFTAGTLNAAIEAEAAKLNVGEVSKPIATNNGYEIIKLIDKKEIIQQPLAEVKEQIIEQLKRNELTKKFAELTDELSHLTYSNPDSLNVAAEQLQLPIKSTELFTEKGGPTELTQNARVLAAAFNSEVKDQGVNSDLITVDTDKLIVLRKKQYQPAAHIPLSEVKENIVAQLILTAKQEKAKQAGEAILAKLQAGEDKEKLASMAQAQWQSVSDVKRTDTRVPSSITNEAFALAPPIDDKQWVASGITLANGNYTVIQVMKVKPGEVENITKEQTQIIRNQIENARGLITFELYTHYLRNQANIEISNR